nr:ribonuclease H-like domain-containing protein [Tanacetum cinerariifolium]
MVTHLHQQDLFKVLREEKLARKKELKARGTLLVALPNEHQLKFNSYKTAKSIMEAIEKRFGGNKESKKVQKTLLKQQYEKFNGTSSEGLDQIYDRLQKLTSQLEIHEETISQKDLNMKLLRINTAHSVSAASSKTNASSLPNVDSLSDAVIYSFFASQSNSPQESRACNHQDNRNRKAPRRTMPIEDTTSNVLVTQCDGLGYNWSDQAEDGPTNFALMAYTSSSSSSSSNSDTEVFTCSKSCLKSYETLNEHYDNLTKDFNKSQFNLGAYKAGLASVEARLKVYKHKDILEDDIKILKLEVMLRDKAITKLRQKFKKAKKERDDLKLTLEKFKGLSKNLSRLLDSQQSDKSKTGLGYDSQGVDSQMLENQDVVSESVTSLPDIAKSKVKTSETKLKNVNAPIIKDWVSDSEDEDEIKTKSKQIKPSFAKEKFVKSTKHVKSTRKSIKQEDSNRQTKYLRKTSQSPRVLTNSGLKTLNTARLPSSRAAVTVTTARPINTAYPRSTMNGAKPSSNVFHKSHSPVRRTFNQRTTPQNSDLKETVNTAKVNNVTTPGTKAVVSAIQGNGENAAKSLACWIWRPIENVIDHISKDSGSYTLKRFNYDFDNRCSRHMTGNKSFLIDYQEIDGGFVAFGRSPKGGKITGKGKIRTGKLDFEDVYFVNELKFNLFSVLQMCDKKNNVLLIETECFVLSPDFKLLDENQVLLKVPRHNNMYSFDLKNVAPSGGLTCLFAKAIIDGYNLWHMRVRHINFKTMNKLVRGNLVRGLPSKIFENDRTCVAYQKGKQHKASCKTKLNRVLVTKPHNKTPYELLIGRSPNIDFIKPFGCPVTILNILDHLGKFKGKADEGFLVGYSVNRRGPEWLFDIDSLIKSMTYEPVTAGNQTYDDAGIEINSSDDKDADEVLGKEDEGVSKGSEINDQEMSNSSTQDVNTVGPGINTANTNINTGSLNINTVGFNDPSMPTLKETGIFNDVYDDREVGAEADTNNLELSTVVSPILTTRVHKDHPKEKIIGDLNLTTQKKEHDQFF